jgi:carbon monoxide dehydrogenase subunit G
MFEISPSVRIDAPPGAVWAFLIDVEGWWVPSSPEHESIEVLSDDDVLRGDPAPGA